MTRLTLATVTMPSADLGPESALPPLPGDLDVHAAATAGPGVPSEVTDNLGHGHPASMLPYSVQDGYRRTRRDRDHRVAVLDNGILRATVALDLGGRLLSLVDLGTGRELLYRNPVFQPANLALRNAWFSGGVEWNLGTTGHTPLTCAPMHAARVDTGSGPLLRLWEYERLRRVTYQLDFILPSGSSMLYVGVRIRNPRPEPVAMYWWSNIAVPDRPGTRVIAPAAAAYRFGYEGRLDVIDTPRHDGRDYSYPVSADLAADYFFRVDDPDPWIAAVDADGTGLVQASTARLKGRKLFVWGNASGGRHWQDWLTEPGTGGYLEIQAGLAHTQLEHLPMPAGADWSWLEAYGRIDTDPTSAHSPEWAVARSAVADRLAAVLPPGDLEARHRRWLADADLPPAEHLHHGSGWGALEEERRRTNGLPGMAPPGIVFAPDTLGAAQDPWRELLRSGRLPSEAPAAPVDAGWRDLLDRAAGTDWHTWYQRGLARCAAGDLPAAREAFAESVAATESAVGLRALARLDLCAAAGPDDPRTEAALDLYRRAVGLAPDLPQLVVECGTAMMEAGRPELVAGIVSPAVREVPRVVLLRLRAAIETGDDATAERIFAPGFTLPDIREGDEVLDRAWFRLAERRLAAGGEVTEDVRRRARIEYPLPYRFDFRMAPDDTWG